MYQSMCDIFMLMFVTCADLYHAYDNSDDEIRTIFHMPGKALMHKLLL